MADPFHNRLNTALKQQRDGHLFRELKICPSDKINLVSNDYFQLRTHPEVIASAQEALNDYGSGSGASPLLYGYYPCHQELLKKILDWKNKPAGLLFNSGFTANQAVIRHLPGPRDLILVDRLIHHSVAQALKLGKTRFHRYRHLDMAHLEELLHKNLKTCETLFVVTESVFSMDGDYPALKELAELKKKYGFVWILDEAHGTGVFGSSGAGLAEEQGVLDDVDILVGTLGKALASFGAYVLTKSKTVIDYLVNFAGEIIYSTYLAPAQAGAASKAIDLIRQSNEKRNYLREISTGFREQLQSRGYENGGYQSPIVPIVLGDNLVTLGLQHHLLENNFLVGAVRPPTVPVETSRLRISLHTGMTQDQLDDFLRILDRWKDN